MLTDQELQILELLLRKYSDDAVDQAEFAEREKVRFCAAFDLESRDVPTIEEMPQ
jgi:hypothetical protein